jgi:hypothetical protein
MWARFLTKFNWEATPAVTIVFKPDGGPLKDGRYLVTHACAAAAGDKAVRCERPVGIGRQSAVR